MPRFTTRLRYGLARMLAKGATFSIVPSWVTTSVLNPTFRSLVRDGYLKSSAYFACVSALTFAFPEPALGVFDGEGDDAKALPKHPLRQLLRQPFTYPGRNGQTVSMMGEDELFGITMTYMAIGGVGYWYKLRGKGNQVVGLRPYHAGHILPVPGGPGWVSHYLYDMEGTAGTASDRGYLPQIDPADIIAFKWPSVDPAQPWTSVPPIVSAADAVDTGVEAARYAYTLLKNDAVPRTVLTVPADRPLDDDEVRRMKAQWAERYGGENRGGVAILEGGTTVARLGLDMQQMGFEALAKVPERQICAVMRTPSVVAGLGDDPTYANSEQAYYRWTRSTLVPFWNLFASTISARLLPDFGSGEGIEARFDLTKVAALQEDANAKWKRTTDAWKGGLIKRNEGRRLLGLAEDGNEGDVYYSIPAKPAPAAPAVPVLEDGQAPKTFVILQDGSMIELPSGATRIMQERAALPARRSVKGGLDDLSDLEGQIEKAFRRYLRAEYRKASNAILNMDKAGELDPDVVQQLGLDLGPGAQRIMNKFYPKVLQRAYDDAGFTLDLDLAFDQANDKVQEVLKNLAKLVVRIAETTREAIRALIGRQAAEGWSLQRLAKEILDAGLVVSRSRALMIARTETAAAYSQGSMLAYAQSGLVESIEWLATIDEQTCSDCKALDGTTTKLGKAFSDGSTAPPRHPQCRCAISPILK